MLTDGGDVIVMSASPLRMSAAAEITPIDKVDYMEQTTKILRSR